MEITREEALIPLVELQGKCSRVISGLHHCDVTVSRRTSRSRPIRHKAPASNGRCWPARQTLERLQRKSMTQRRREQGLVELTLLAAKRVTCREVRGTVSHTMALNKDHKISCGRGDGRGERGEGEEGGGGKNSDSVVTTSVLSGGWWVWWRGGEGGILSCVRQSLMQSPSSLTQKPAASV